MAASATHHSIRVHFEFGEKSDYKKLKESLKKIKISDLLPQPNGPSLQLPLGEYYIHSTHQPEELRELIYEIASQISKASVIVTSGQNIAWVGLESA